MFGGAATAFSPKGAEKSAEKPGAKSGGADDMDELRAELAALQAKVDRLDR